MHPKIYIKVIMWKMAEVKDVCSSPPARVAELAVKTINRRMLEPPQKETPRPKKKLR